MVDILVITDRLRAQVFRCSSRCAMDVIVGNVDST